MRTVLFAILATFTLAQGVTAQNADMDLKRLQGDWQLTAVTVRGKMIPADRLKDKQWRFEGDKLIPLDNKTDVATVKLDPSKKPATFDITDKAGAVNRCIYKLEGDRLTLCISTGSDRPTEFAAPDGKDHALLVLERVKK